MTCEFILASLNFLKMSSVGIQYYCYHSQTLIPILASAPAPIDILYEIRALRPDLFSKIDIMMDGGVRSGADVVKALALGAKAVGMGRPFLYANGTHGQEGVERLVESESKAKTCYCS